MKILNKILMCSCFMASMLCVSLFLNTACKHGSGKLTLASLEIDGKAIAISDNINAGNTAKARVLVVAKALPNGASVSFDAPLNKEGKWELNFGENKLKIVVSKGNEKKEYNVHITRVDNAPSLKKLTINGRTIEGKENIKDDEPMTFGVLGSMQSVQFEAEADMEGAVITCEPSLSGDTLPLKAQPITEVKIIVEKQGFIREYQAVIHKIAKVFKFSAGSIKGVDSESSDADAIKIFSRVPNTTISLSGTQCALYAGTTSVKWTSFKINGTEYASQLKKYKNFHSVAFIPLELGEKGKETDIELEIEAQDASNGQASENDSTLVRETFRFKLVRDSETIDLPFNALYLDGKDVTTSKTGYQIKQLFNGSGLSFEAGKPCDVKISMLAELQGATIAGQQVNATKQKNKDGKDIWVVESTVDEVSYNGTEITCVLQPKNTEDYHDTHLKCTLNKTDLLPMKLDYSINGMTNRDVAVPINKKLPDAFNQAIEHDGNPLINVEGNYLHLALSVDTELESVSINGNTLPQEKIIITEEEQNKRSSIIYSLDLQGIEQSVVIGLNPLHKGRFLKKIFSFRVKGDGVAPKLAPTFRSISGDTNLQKASFLDKLASSVAPVYDRCTDKAIIVVALTEYEGEFLVDKVLVNDEETTLEKLDLKRLVEYQLRKEIQNIDENGKIVKIEFKGKHGVSDVKWEFKLKNENKAPQVAQDKISLFEINEYGGKDGTPFTEEFEAGLADDTVLPVFEFYGKKAKVRLGTGDNALLKNVTFKLDGTEKATVTPESKDEMSQVEYAFVLDDVNIEHAVEILINPASNKFSPLKYTFKLKSVNEKAAPKYVFAVNEIKRSSGYKGKVRGERANLLVQLREDVMESVEVIVGSEPAKQCTISSRGSIWEARLDVDLTDSEQTFNIKVTPKNTMQYPVVNCKYYLKGVAVSPNNAEFSFKANGKPDVSENIKWLTGLESNKYNDDYGANTVSITAKTVSATAKVHWQIVNPIDNKAIAGADKSGIMEEGDAKGKHVAKNVQLYDDKPTKIKMWVVSQSGKTDDTFGTFYFTYNPVMLCWSYDNNLNKDNLKQRAWDVIQIDKNRVKNGTIYLAFLAWKSSYGYQVNNQDLPTEQSEVKRGDEIGMQQLYTCSVDVKKLVDATASELNAMFKMKAKNVECMKYKVKIETK